MALTPVYTKEWVKQHAEDIIVRDRVKYLYKLIKKLPINTDSIIDIGCGSGTLTDYLTGKGYNVIGIDNSASNIAYADNNMTGKFRNVSILDMQTLKEQYDLVIISHLLEHFELPETILDEITPIMKDNSAIIIAVPNKSAMGDNWWRKLIKNDIYGVDHRSFITPSHLTSMLERAGLKNIEMITRSATPAFGQYIIRGLYRRLFATKVSETQLAGSEEIRSVFDKYAKWFPSCILYPFAKLSERNNMGIELIAIAFTGKVNIP